VVSAIWGHLDEFEIKVFQHGFTQLVVEQGVTAGTLELGQNPMPLAETVLVRFISIRIVQ